MPDCLANNAWRSQESGKAACHAATAKLASYSKWNESRDFWRFCHVPVVTC